MLRRTTAVSLDTKAYRSEQVEIYAEGQIKNVLPFVNHDINWFILGGTADANEAQVLHQELPHVKIVGFEPNPVMFQTQISRNFPGSLLPLALWDKPSTEILYRDGNGIAQNRSASLVRHTISPIPIDVQCVELDTVSSVIGPFVNSFLWLDIEGAELQALKGARCLLADPKGIQVINLEAIKELEQGLTDYLKSFGFEEIHRWNEQEQPSQNLKWCDIVYKRCQR